MLYILKLSAPKGLWFSLRTADPAARKVAITYQRHQQRLMKAELDLKFLLNCRDQEVYPTHVKWKILQKLKPRERVRHHKRNLGQSIAEMSSKIRSLKAETQGTDTALRSALTWMKYSIFRISIRRNTEKIKENIILRHQKKLDRLLVEKAMKEGTTKNPNKLITNLADIELSNEEVEILTLGLNHGLAL